MQIIILGMHRSGTSMITRLINMCGAYFGPEKSSIGFNKDNPKGFWERREVMAINDDILNINNCAWDRLGDWPFGHTKATPQPINRAMRGLVLDMDAFRPWVMKDPRLCLTLPYWRPHLEMPVAVIAHRDPVETALSLERRNSIPVAYGMAMWEYHAVELINSTLDMPRIHVRYTDFLADPVNTTYSLLEALQHEDVRGLRQPSGREIEAFVDTTLYRAKATKRDTELLTSHQRMLVSLITGEAAARGPVEISGESVRVVRAGF